jgi:hypothetical protein
MSGKQLNSCSCSQESVSHPETSPRSQDPSGCEFCEDTGKMARNTNSETICPCPLGDYHWYVWHLVWILRMLDLHVQEIS